MTGIRSILDGWEQEDWFPDVVVIDYADILLPVNPREEKIAQIKTDWEEMRKLSLERDCLVVTGTQANAATYSKKIQGRENFSGNHLKMAEVTALVGINFTGEEKDAGITRLNYIVRRTGAWNARRCVHVAGCLTLANPAVRSVFPTLRRPAAPAAE